MEIVLLLISGAFAIVAYGNYKVYKIHKNCIAKTKGIVSNLKHEGSYKTAYLVGNLSFQTSTGKWIKVKYEKGKFNKIPNHNGFFFLKK